MPNRTADFELPEEEELMILRSALAAYQSSPELSGFPVLSAAWLPLTAEEILESNLENEAKTPEQWRRRRDSVMSHMLIYLHVRG